jgi:hypothetical protein
MERVKVALSRPIKVGDDELSELLLREPTAGDLEATDGADGDVAKSILLIAKLADVPPSSIRSLRAKDLQTVSEAIAPFLPQPPQTGRKSSRT